MATTITTAESGTAALEIDFDELNIRLHNLPQELFDLIGEFVLSPGPEMAKKRVVRMKKGQRVPSVLHINHASRQASAERYYTNSIFEFHAYPYKTWMSSEIRASFACEMWHAALASGFPENPRDTAHLPP